GGGGGSPMDMLDGGGGSPLDMLGGGGGGGSPMDMLDGGGGGGDSSGNPFADMLQFAEIAAPIASSLMT
ncbi:MAG: hypothetical protein ACRD3W_25720, partial [Terriglobales bacterium]